MRKRDPDRRSGEVSPAVECGDGEAAGPESHSPTHPVTRPGSTSSFPCLSLLTSCSSCLAIIDCSNRFVRQHRPCTRTVPSTVRECCGEAEVKAGKGRRDRGQHAGFLCGTRASDFYAGSRCSNARSPLPSRHRPPSPRPPCSPVELPRRGGIDGLFPGRSTTLWRWGSRPGEPTYCIHFGRPVHGWHRHRLRHEFTLRAEAGPQLDGIRRRVAESPTSRSQSLVGPTPRFSMGRRPTVNAACCCSTLNPTP